MTKRYGSLVGAVKQVVPFRPVDSAYENTNDQVLVRDVCNLAAAPAADTIQLFITGWETVVDLFASQFGNDAMGAGVLLAVGDVTFPAALLTGQALSVAGQGRLFGAVSPAKYGQPLWQMLGYADLKTARKVGPKCEVLGTLSGAAATGNIAWLAKGQARI